MLSQERVDEISETEEEHRESECWAVIDGALVIYDIDDPPLFLKHVDLVVIDVYCDKIRSSMNAMGRTRT